MPQLHLYVPEAIARKVQEKAKARNLPVSRYLAEVIKREVGEGWPEGYFDRVCGKCRRVSRDHSGSTQRTR